MLSFLMNQIVVAIKEENILTYRTLFDNRPESFTAFCETRTLRPRLYRGDRYHSEKDTYAVSSVLHPSPSNGLEINKPRPCVGGGGGVLAGGPWRIYGMKKNLDITKPRYGEQISGALNDCFLENISSEK